MICPNQVNLRKDRFPGQRGREILQSWHRVAIINRDCVQPTVIAAWTPTPARFRNDVEGRRPRAARSSDDTHSFHLIKLLFSIGELFRRQSAGSGEYGRTLRQDVVFNAVSWCCVSKRRTREGRTFVDESFEILCC